MVGEVIEVKNAVHTYMVRCNKVKKYVCTLLYMYIMYVKKIKEDIYNV